MSDSQLDAIRRKKLLALQRKLAQKENKTEPVNANEALDRVFRGRAWEVFNAASYQFPQAMSRIKDLLAELASSGKIKEVTGEQLYLFLANLGLKVRLDTKIEFASHGELKPIAEKLKSELKKT
jgi:DNA-binding TFAR19-related protein (PDSD5 family)